MKQPEISVVIPTLARITALENCLGSLAKQTFSSFEIILVSLKAEELFFLKEKYNMLKINIIKQAENGLTSARNTGLSASCGRIISFIDDDVSLSPCWAREILDTFNKSKRIGGVSGPTIIPDELVTNRDILSFFYKADKNIFWKMAGACYKYFVLEGESYRVGKIFKSGAFSIGANYEISAKIAEEQEVDYLEACNMSFRRDCLQRVGGFSSEYKGVGDWSEPDLAFKVRGLGYKLFFNPRAVLNHNLSQQGVFTERSKDSYQRARNFLYFYFKWIKLDTPEKFFRFGINLLFLNLYWCYKFIQTGKAAWLGGLIATKDFLLRGNNIATKSGKLLFKENGLPNNHNCQA